MTNKGISKNLFAILDKITDVYPSFGPKVFEKLFLFLPGMKFVYQSYVKRAQDIIEKAGEIKSILMIADVNIGDSLLIQSSLKVLKSYFPEAGIDFFCNRKGGELFSGEALGVNVINEFTNSGIPKEEDSLKISKLIKANDYSLVFNVSPFVERKYLKDSDKVLNLYVPLAYYIMHLWKSDSNEMNISLLTFNFFNELLKPFSPFHILNSDNKEHFHLLPVFKGNSIHLSKEAADEAVEILNNNKVFDFEGLMFFNNISSSRFTTIPFHIQQGIIEKCVRAENIKRIIMFDNANNNFEENELFRDISPEHFSKIIFIPYKISFSVYAALIDQCEVFISGDTGPVHIAAARKEPLSNQYKFKNSTAVLTVFGGTDSRIYGYDTDKHGHFAAYQNAPSKVFNGNAVCRNISCLNKLGKSCKNVKCFDCLNPDEIAEYIISYFNHLQNLKILKELVKV